MSIKKIQENEVILKRLLSALDASEIKKYGRGKKVAEKTGYSESRVSEMLSGKIDLVDKFITVVCAKFGISEYWVLTGETTLANTVEEPSTEYISIPVHTLAGAGDPCCLESAEPIDYLKIDSRYDGDNICVIKIRGRSMEPLINDGGYVGIDRTDKSIVSGEMFALWLPHEGAVVKRLWMMPDMVRIMSDNKDSPSFDIPLHRINWDTFILGRVKWVLQSF